MVKPVTQQQYIFNAHINKLFSQDKACFAGNTFTALIFAAMFWDRPSAQLILPIWLSLMIFVQCFRLGLALCFHYAQKSQHIMTSRRWLLYYDIGFIASTLLWVFLAFTFYHEPSSLHRMFLVFVISSVVAGGMSMISPFKYFDSLYPVVLLLPIVVMLLSSVVVIEYVMGAMLSVYMFVMRSTARHINATALDSVVSHYELESLANFDSLTKVANRRFFDSYFYNEYKRALRNNSEIALILLDVDFFKQYNDTYGHQQGDVCLREVAKTIKEEIKRPADFVARYGGEEFAVVLPDTSMDGALVVARNIKEAIFAKEITHKGSHLGQVSVSCGVASQVPTENLNTFALLSAADQALYLAKDQGRNSIAQAACFIA